MITKTSNTITNLKNLWIEMFLNKTNKVSNIADGSVLNAVAFGTAKVAQKAIKDIAIVEAQIFPTSATGTYLDKSAALFGVSPRKQALGSSTYVRVYAEPGTLYEIGTNFISKNGIRFVVDQALTVDSSGYGYVSVRSAITGSATNVEANSITQVSPRPLTHIECTNEYGAIGGRDYEDDETFRNRIINYNNRLSEGTIESWTQIFQDLDDRILKVMNVGLGEDGKTHIYLVTQNGSFFTDDELEELLEKATPYFGLTELNLSGNSVGIVLENAKWMYVGGERGIDFRVELDPNINIADARKAIQIAMTKYLDFRFWEAGRIVQWDDLLQVVKTAEGVKYVPDQYFFPYYDEEVPLNMLPRIKAFRMRDLEGNILYDSGQNLSNIFYPAGENDIYKGTQSTIFSQRYLVSFTVTTLKRVNVPGALITIGNKIITTDEAGTANILLENGEYKYTLNKANWIQKTGEFVILNAPVFITINNFEATPYKVTFTVYEREAPMQGATIKIGIYTLETDIAGIASTDLEPGTYSYTITKAGFKTIESVLTVENRPVEIFERMFLESMAVNFAVIDRRKSIYVPQANITVKNMTEETNSEGQAQMGLESGQYEMRVLKEGYQEYNETITVSGDEQNCVLVELDAIPYEVKFTVLDENDYVLPNASVLINNSTYLTDEQGVAIISLPNGLFTYTIFKSGYMFYSNSVTIDGAPISVVVRLEQAFYTLRLIVRDIDNGNYIQGAELNINNETKITNVNGVATITLGNGTYDYVLTQRNYKRYTGSITIKDQDVVETVYLELRDTVISYQAIDDLTGEPIKEVSIQLVNKGTGITVDSGFTNDIGKLLLAAEAGEYTWTASHRNYVTVTQDITLEKLKDIDLPFRMTRKIIDPEVDVIESIPGVSGDATSVRQKGENTIETLSGNGYYYIAHLPEEFLTPNSGVTFDLNDYVQTFRRAEVGGIDEPYDFTEGGARLVYNISYSGEGIATLEGSVVTISPNAAGGVSTRSFYIDATITTDTSQVAATINVVQEPAINFNPVKQGLSITVKDTRDDTISTYLTDADGKIFPNVTPGVRYELTVTESGFYENEGKLIKTWDFGASVPTLMEVICTKQIELRVKQENTTRPLAGASISITGMSLPQSVVSGSDGSARIYISPVKMDYICSIADHITKTGSFTPPLTNDYYDIIMSYEVMTFSLNVDTAIPYATGAANCPITVTSTWGGAAEKQYTFTGSTNNNGQWITTGNGMFNIPPGSYRITYGGGNSNYDQKVENIVFPADESHQTTVVRRQITVTYTVKEIIPSISETASNPVKAGLVLAPYYNDLSGDQSSGSNVTTNASGQFTKTVYAGLPERFRVQPTVFYQGNGSVATVNYSDVKTATLTYTCSKSIPVYITSNYYGALAGATVVFSGMSVNQTQTTNASGIVNMYISPVAMSYTVSKQYYVTKTGNFTPTGDETRMDIELSVGEYPVTFHVSTGGIIPPENIVVRIENNNVSSIVFEGRTNINGDVTIPDVPIGNYTYAVLAGEVATDTFVHPQNEQGTEINVDVPFELVNAGMIVSEVYGSAGRSVLANQTVTMTSKAGTITLTLDENGYINATLVKGLEYTFTTDAYPEFYSNPTQSYIWEEDGVIWNFDLNVTATLTINVKDQYANTNVPGVTLTWNSQTIDTDNSGNAVFFRTALTKPLGGSKDDYQDINADIEPTQTSPLNLTIYRNKQTVSVIRKEQIPGIGTYGSSNIAINYTSAAGNGTINAADTTFEAYLGIPITFSIKESSQAAFYSNPSQIHTYTASGESWDLIFTCSETIVINVRDDVPGEVISGASVTYFHQTKTTDASGNSTFYRTSVDSIVNANAANTESWNGTLLATSTSPFNITMTRAVDPVVLVVKEVIPGVTARSAYANLQIRYTIGSVTGTLTTDASGSVTFDGYIGAEMTFTVVGYPSYYSNSTQRHTYTAANQSWTMELNITATVDVKVVSNVPANSILPSATVTYFNQTKTTNSSGLCTFYRSSNSHGVSSSVTYHSNYSGTITAAATSPVTLTMSRLTGTVNIIVTEKVLLPITHVLRIAYTPDLFVVPGYGGFHWAVPTRANQETVAYFWAKIPAGRTIEFASNATGNNPVRKWISPHVGTGNWAEYYYYVRAGSDGSFSSTHFYYITDTSSNTAFTWEICAATVFDLTGSNLQNASNETIISRCTYDRIMPAYKDIRFQNGVNGVYKYNNANTNNPVITRVSVSNYGNDYVRYPYPSMKMIFSPAASTSPVTLDSNGAATFACYLGTPITFTPETRANYYNPSSTAKTFTAVGQTYLIDLICSQRIVLKTVANIWNTNNALDGTITYFGQTATSGGTFYRSGLDRPLTATATYFNNYVGTVTAIQTSPYTVTMNRTTRTVTLTVVEKYNTSNTYPLGSAAIVRSVPSTSNAPAGEITLDGNGRKTNTVYAGINYTYTPKNNASYYSNASQGHTWSNENEAWTMTLTITARLTFNIKSSNYNTNISGVSGSYFGQTGTTDGNGNWTVYRSGINRGYSFSKTNYNAISGTLSSTQASPLNLKMSETSSSITITIKDYYQGATKGNANGCPVRMTNNSLSSITFSGTTNANGQVSFGPMIAGTYTLSWGGGTSYWIAASGTIAMPKATDTSTATRLTKVFTTEFRVSLPDGTQGWWGNNTLMKPVFTTAGVATTVTLGNNQNVYYAANYTWIAGITTTIAAKLTNYFVTGLATTTEKPYTITPNYNFSNIGHNTDATAFYSTAIKAITVTVQNYYTSAAVSGATVSMYGLNGNNAKSGSVGANYMTQTKTTNSSGQVSIYISGLTNRYVVSATKYVTRELTNANTTNFTIRLVPNDVVITISVKDANTGASVGTGCVVKLSSNNSSTSYSGTTNSNGQVALTVKPGNYWWEAGGTTTWGQSGGSGTYHYANRSSSAVSLVMDQTITIQAVNIGNQWIKLEVSSDCYNDVETGNIFTGSHQDPGRALQINNSFASFGPGPRWYNSSLVSTVLSFSQGSKGTSSFKIVYSANSNTSSDRKWTSYTSSSYTLAVSGICEYYFAIFYNEWDPLIVVLYGIPVGSNFNTMPPSVNEGLQSYLLGSTSVYRSIAQLDVVTERINTGLGYEYFNNYSARNIAQTYKHPHVYVYNDNNYRYRMAVRCIQGTSYLNVNILQNLNGTISIVNSVMPDLGSSQLYQAGLYLVAELNREYVGGYHYYNIYCLVRRINKSSVTNFSFDVIQIESQYPVDDYNELNSNYTLYFYRKTAPPTAIQNLIGGDLWISTDKKWWFYIQWTNANKGGFTKGLHCIYANGNVLFDATNGWAVGNSYSIDPSLASVIRNACSDIYVLDVVLDKTTTKMIVFGNTTNYCFHVESSGGYYSLVGVQPNKRYYFQFVGGKWIQLNSETMTDDGFWTTYTSVGEAYRPTINHLNPRDDIYYEFDHGLSFVLPGGKSPLKGYRYNLFT